MDTKPSHFIFYLILEEKLPATYYIFDRTMRDLGFILVPVRIDQLQTLVSSTEQNQVIVLTSTTDSREFKLYNDRVRGLLKYILKSKRITFMHLSSFAKLNDSKQFAFGKNYFFLKYPLDARVLSARIALFHEEKSEKSSKWPGGTRAGVKSMAV